MDESDLQRQVTELLEQRAAISAVLRAVASSPHQLQPIFDTLLDYAGRLCRAKLGYLILFEQNGYRLVARRGPSDPFFANGEAHVYPVPPDGLIARLIKDRAPIHIADLATDQSYVRRNPATVALVEGAGCGTCLLVPMLTEDELVGAICIFRAGVQPFTDTQIDLITDFAAPAAIALESTRRERRYRETQTALAHVNRVATMGQLTASIAHEVKQPLAAAAANGKAGLNWLTRSAPEIGEAKECVEHSLKSIDRAVQIIERIHRLVKNTLPEKQRLDVNETIEEVIELVRGKILKNGVAIRTEVADCLPRLQGDRVQLQQVILNLIVNALQAMSNVSDGTRELAVATNVVKSGDAVYVAVRDSGPGPGVENLERLFQPFYTTKPDGMGMGLSICRKIIEDHGGRLWASANVPRGAVFQFTLPASPHNALTAVANTVRVTHFPFAQRRSVMRQNRRSWSA
jgi:signal transduction histidine kinase